MVLQDVFLFAGTIADNVRVHADITDENIERALVLSHADEFVNRLGGIHAQVAITSAWRDLPVPGWEMCRVLGNLIDNAADATRQVENREIGILLGEDEQGYRFAVENTGPDVPAELRERIFEAGFSTKGEGHGMGLAIVREILEQYGGRLELESKNGRTRFSGWIPRETREDNPSAG